MATPYRYTIWDLDNCLFDDSWRWPLIDWHLEGDDRYRRYNEDCHKDPVHHVAEFRLMEQMATPVFFTGRSIEFWRQSGQALRNGLQLEHPNLFMRYIGERSEPAELKRRMLNEFLKTHHLSSIIAGFDDLPEVLSMYRERGIPTALLKIHNVDAYNQPVKDLA
jgi:hypothetical protein